MEAKFIPLMQCAASPMEKAGIKLGRARAVADLVFALDSHEGYDDLDSNTIGNAMVLVRELIDEAREFIGTSGADAQEESAHAR